MLKLIEEKDEIEIIGELCNDSFGLTISSLINAYPPETNLCPCWYQVTGDELTAVLCSFGGEIVLWSNIRAEYDEIKSFITSLGYEKIICRARDVVSLDLFACACGQIWRREAVTSKENTVYEKPDTVSDYKEIFELLDIGGDFEEWFADISRRINNGCADMRFIRKDGKIISTASLLHIYGDKAMLGAVATDKAFVGQGYASALINSFEDKTVYLRCLPALNKFYEKLGFRSVDVWAEIRQGN